MTREIIRFGFLPLTDAAIPIAAHEMGFAAEEGVALALSRETSWANIRDRMAVGQFDAAHLLAPMPIAAALQLLPLSSSIMVPMALGLGGNAVTVSSTLWAEMKAKGATSLSAAREMGTALRQVIRQRERAGVPKLVFGIVHAFSAHNYDLRYWLAECGINPVLDVSIAVVPPPLMPEAMQAGHLDGYCVGEPWNTAAAARGTGVIVTSKIEIWKDSPEKVLGVRESWTDSHQDELRALLRAFDRSARWCANPSNATALASLLSLPAYLAQPVEVILPALTGSLQIGDAQRNVPGFLSFDAPHSTTPDPAHAAWFYAQMVRWGQADPSNQNLERAMKCFRPEVYAEAIGIQHHQLAEVGGFFDGRIFDPKQIESYLASLPFAAA
ncbi:MAG: CmpA/NrtA family ABC transporter substrate-binding protein [Aestuariivirga sp.]